MRKFNSTQLNLNEIIDEGNAEITDMEKLLEGESIHEATEEQDEYTDLTIIPFTFEDGMLPRRDGKVGSLEQFEKVFSKNERVMANKNMHGLNVFIATKRTDLFSVGYVIMNTAEFIRENPDSLYDIWVELLNEISGII